MHTEVVTHAGVQQRQRMEAEIVLLNEILYPKFSYSTYRNTAICNLSRSYQNNISIEYKVTTHINNTLICHFFGDQS